MSNKHTPGPFRIAENEWNLKTVLPWHGAVLIEGDINSGLAVPPLICALYRGVEANAAFIVRACNAHDELLAACGNAEAVMSIVEPRSDKAEYLACLAQLRAAISKARGP